MLTAGNPKGITRGPDGNLWIAEAGGSGAIARVGAYGSVTQFSAGLTPSDPWDITAGPDGNLWFVSRSPALVGRITPSGSITQFSTGLTANSMPTSIAAGPDGNLWFTESADPGRIGRITPAGVITENSIGLTPSARSRTAWVSPWNGATLRPASTSNGWGGSASGSRARSA